MSDVRENLARVQDRVAEACRRAARPTGSVKLVAISKHQPFERLQAAYAAGQRVFGENYVQSLEARTQGFEALPARAADIEWHLIGHVQSNKARRALAAAWIHSVDSERIGRTLARVAQEAGVKCHVLLEVNLAAEPSKTGVLIHELPDLVSALSTLSSLVVGGLMCIPPEGQGRRHFAELRRLRDDLEASHGIHLPELSMGMSGDFEDAILEGSTLVRVGTSIFGERA
ncbi:MAG: YggS family pyridoxal phosphate-dependent enzyme [Deltaproteobacteria bacterium]|nr:YggS family pyridoxal phosphate-dependent enzyme [Deltaproteobacteria bacterium]